MKAKGEEQMSLELRVQEGSLRQFSSPPPIGSSPKKVNRLSRGIRN